MSKNERGLCPLFLYPDNVTNAIMLRKFLKEFFAQAKNLLFSFGSFVVEMCNC